MRPNCTAAKLSPLFSEVIEPNNISLSDKQDRQCRYYLTLLRVGMSIVAVEKQ